MNANIMTIPNAYGFGYDWSLFVETPNGVKNFYLGQDVKFCRRILGMQPSEVVNEIGSNDLRNPAVLKKLANFIIDKLGLNETEIDSLQSWELCCQ